MVEQSPRIGDVWRKRYRGLTLHTVHFYVQMPYLSYPGNWPVLPPKELIGDWFEAYAWILQLNVWTSSNVVSARYDESAERWTVELNRNGEQRTVVGASASGIDIAEDAYEMGAEVTLVQ